ncbi:MAG: hypothetical protein V3S51_00170, partial [Dehalococcoidia bacterium]
ESYTAPVESLAVGVTDALSYRVDHLMGRTPENAPRISLSRFLVSFLVTALIIAAVLVPMPGSQPV